MSLSTHVKPISFLKANAATVAKELKAGGEPYIITQNGEAAMVVQSVAEYERNENAFAMLQLITAAEGDIAEGRTIAVEDAFAATRKRLGLADVSG